jgi:hypothetical protein
MAKWREAKWRKKMEDGGHVDYGNWAMPIVIEIKLF